MSDCGGDPNCTACSKQRQEGVKLQDLLELQSRYHQATRIQNVEKAFHLAVHWDGARAGLLEQGYTPVQALNMLADPRLKICSSGCVHQADQVKGSGRLPPGTKPRVRKWSLRP